MEGAGPHPAQLQAFSPAPCGSPPHRNCRDSLRARDVAIVAKARAGRLCAPALTAGRQPDAGPESWYNNTCVKLTHSPVYGGAVGCNGPQQAVAVTSNNTFFYLVAGADPSQETMMVCGNDNVSVVVMYDGARVFLSLSGSLLRL
jgi:hypothetical protein